MTKTYGLIETKILRKFDHYEVYVDGEFVCSEDTVMEAVSELEKYLEETRSKV